MATLRQYLKDFKVQGREYPWQFRRVDAAEIMAKVERGPLAIEDRDLAKAREIASDKNLSADGRKKAGAALKQKTAADLAAWRDPLVTQLETAKAAYRARQHETLAALTPTPTSDPAAALVAELRAQEVRGLARAADEVGRKVLWLNASREMKDALMNAPDAIIPKELVEEERARRLALADPEAAASLQDWEDLTNIYTRSAAQALHSIEEATGAAQESPISTFVE